MLSSSWLHFLAWVLKYQLKLALLLEHFEHTHILHNYFLQDSGGELDLDQSSEILTFHTAIDNLVESEEQLVTEHKAIIQADQYLLEEEKQLLGYVDDVNHDIEQYVTHMERIVSQKLERLSQFKGQI